MSSLPAGGMMLDPTALQLVQALPSVVGTAPTDFASRVRALRSYLALRHAEAAGLAAQLPTVMPTTGWATIGALPATISGAAVSTDGTRIYHSHGNATNAIVNAYAVATDGTVTAMPNAPTARKFVAGAWCNGKHYAIGGLNSSNTTVTTNEAYTPAGTNGATGTWNSPTALPAAIAHAAAAAVGNFIYVAGGQTGAALSTAGAFFYRYDTVANTWTSLSSTSPLPAARTQGAMVAVGTKLYYLGGYNNSGTAQKSVYVYDTVAGTWSTGTEATSFPGSSATVIGALIYASTGSTYFTYDPATGVSSGQGPATPTAHGSSPALIALGSVLYYVSGSGTANVDRLDPGAATDYARRVALIKNLVLAV